MDVVIKNRDFSDRLPLPASLEVRPVDYVWNQIGGPKTATLKCNFSVDVPNLFNLLRCPVEIYGDDGLPKWWGYVNRVTLPNGSDQMVGLGLDEVYNTVRIEYDDGVTADATNDDSIAEYGVKEYRARVANSDSTQGAQFRDLYLVDHAKARPEFPKSGGNQDVIIECNGWWDTLGWKYYENANTANVEHTTQIVNMVGTAGQFLNGVLIENLANQTSTAERDGTGTALGHIVQLLNAGTSNVRPLLATVDVNRYLHVFEREAEPSSGLPKYFLDRQNQLITHLGNPVPNQDCKVNVWAQLQDPPDILKGFSAMQPFYIAEAKYDVERDKVTYTPANSYEQTRLRKFVAETSSTNSGGGLGGGAVSGVPVWWTPAADPVVTTLNRLHRSGGYGTDIAVNGSVYVTVNTTPTTSTGRSNVTYNGLNYLSPGTDPGGNAGWEVLVSGIYRFELDASIVAGSSAPSSGDYTIAMRRRVSGYTTVGYSSGSVSGSIVFGYLPLVLTLKLNAGDWVNFYCRNFTNGNITVNYIHAVGIYMSAS